MNTNKELLSKGIKYITISLPCLFIGPAVIHFAFINKLQTLYYLILVVGVGVCITAMVMLFIGLNTIMKSLFNK